MNLDYQRVKNVGLEKIAELEVEEREARAEIDIIRRKKKRFNRVMSGTLAILLSALVYVGVKYIPEVSKGKTDPVYAQQLIDDSYQRCQSDDLFTSVEGCFEYHAYSIDFPNIKPQKY